MRKKALLAGAVSGFEGPWVNLESGEWLVELSPDFNLVIEIDEEAKESYFDGPFIEQVDPFEVENMSISGPTRVRAIVSPDYNGPGIFLVAKQISTNGASPCLSQ